MIEQPNLITSNYNQQPSLPNATASLVLGIISIVGAFCYGVVGIVCGIIGLVLANKDRQLYRSAPEMYSLSSYNTSNSGRICSIIGLVVGCVFLVFIIIYFVVFGAIIMEAVRHAR